MFDAPWLRDLDPQQRVAVLHDGGPLLVLAGAGTGKTTTLAARVARLVAEGAPPESILLLTFTRRAAEQMLRRAEGLVARAGVPGAAARRVEGGTFHAVAVRHLRSAGPAIGLDPAFTVLDAADGADLLDLLRDELGVATGDRRFPRKGTIAAIQSRVVNARQPLTEVLARYHPWCTDAAEGLGELFRAAVARKRERALLDFDDLLVWWRALLEVPGVGDHLADRYEHVLVDEYQDTNPLQVDVLRALRRRRPDVTVVGDDAQAIYGFRAGSVRGILGFEQHFPGATVVRLERSYRSAQPVLDLANAIRAEATEGYDVVLWSDRRDGRRVRLHTCADEADQSDRVCEAVLRRREEGVPLREQAVLVRTGHHSDHLEVELGRRGIPYRKFGGLRFLEAAHVKDLVALLRLVDNPADEVAWFRVLQLLEGVGPGTARRVLSQLQPDGPAARDGVLRRLVEDPPRVPAAATDDLAALGAALLACATGGSGVAADVERLRRWYEPVCTRVHDDAVARIADLVQLEGLADGAADRAAFLDGLALDPPASTGDLAGEPVLDEDWLVLSTIHSAKGLEWRSVHVLHAVDGMIPSDLATGTPEEVEEERRLLYVAVTRARDELDLYAPLRYHHDRFGRRAGHGYGQVSRFLQGSARVLLETVGPRRDGRGRAVPDLAPEEVAVAGAAARRAVDELLSDLWR